MICSTVSQSLPASPVHPPALFGCHRAPCTEPAPLPNQDGKPQAPRQPLAAVKYQEVHTTFVRGAVNPAYFGLEKGKDVPSSVVLTESAANLAFSSLALKTWVGDPSEGVGLYKLFSRYCHVLSIACCGWAAGGCGCPQTRVKGQREKVLFE